MIRIERYTGERKQEWNEFCRHAKNSLFMHERDFMEYHRDRFTDHSLLFFYKEKLAALLPMNEMEKELFSHGGLTFGGFITGNGMKQHIMNECFETLVRYMKEHDYSRLHYKCIPYIYYSQPAQEDRYSLFINRAEMEAAGAATAVSLDSPLKMTKGRKAQIARAKREGIEVAELSRSEDYERFIELENMVLERHHTKAVHTGTELKMLHDRFPNSIRLVGARLHSELIAGAVLFEYADLVHTQYMAANEKARETGALDMTVSSVMEHYKGRKRWLDFGISTEDGGACFNEGLAAQKEGFGGRTVIYETWRLDIG